MRRYKFYVGKLFDGFDPEIHKRVSYDIVAGPYDDEDDCINAMYEYDEELHNIFGPNGKRTFTEEQIDRIMNSLTILNI